LERSLISIAILCGAAAGEAAGRALHGERMEANDGEAR